jgi:tetratricopeptide (TPR) repeat protein
MNKVLSFLLFTFYSITSANDCNIQFKKAVQFYEAKQYASSVEQFNRCLDQGIKNAEIYYNIANAQYKDGNLALAILNFEKALKINPLDLDAIHNLTIAQSQQLDKQVSIDRKSIFYQTLYLIPINWSLQISVLLILAWISFVLFSKNKSDQVQLRLYALAVVIFIIAVPIIGSTTYRIYQNEFQKYGIVLNDKAQVLTGPSSKSNSLTTLNSGYKFEILETQNKWSKVKFEDTYGWVLKKSLGDI